MFAVRCRAMVDVRIINNDVGRVEEDLIKILSWLSMGAVNDKTKVLIIVHMLAETVSYERWSETRELRVESSVVGQSGYVLLLYEEYLVLHSLTMTNSTWLRKSAFMQPEGSSPCSKTCSQ